MENYHTLRYGNKDSEIKFGHIHSDEQLSSFLIRSGHDARHFMTMDATGSIEEGRQGGTINSCPGSFQIKCGDDIKDTVPAFYIEAINGDIVLNAKNGRIRMQANNIDIIAEGTGGDNGNITLTANQNIFQKCKNFDVNVSAVAKIVSTGTLKLTGDSLLNIYGGIIDGATGACKLNPSKGGDWETEKENNSLNTPG
jgi:hypothetical protein